MPTAKREEQVFKGLQEAKSRLDQLQVEDSKYPDLYDQLSNQAEPQNYFFEPYATQWCPQLVKKGGVIPLPGVVASTLEDAKTLTLSGLLTGIESAWTSVDTRLFLWSYKHRGRFAVFEFDQAVVAVGLCLKPIAGVFTDKVQHILVVATTVEVVLVAVLYENDDRQAGGIKLQRTKLSVSTDNCVVRRIVTTRQGRIFFGGSDGGLYELLYGPETDALSSALPFFKKPCKKIAHTSSYMNYLPTFLMGLASAPGEILEFALDSEREILYSLHDNGHLSVFDLGVAGQETKLVTSLDLLADGAKYAREYRRTRVSCPDERIFQSNNMQIVSLSVVPRDESALVNVVAVASNGIRFYLTAYSRRAYTVGNAISRAKRPTRLEIVYIRLPPPAIALADAPPYHSKEGMQPGFAPGKSPSSVHVSFHRKGVFLLADGRKDQQDQLVGIAHDLITTSIPTQTTARKPTIRESISLDSCVGKVIEIQELDPRDSNGNPAGFGLPVIQSARSVGSKRSFDEMSSGTIDEPLPIVGEMALQYSQSSRHFLCLTNAGIQVLKKIRPMDQLHRILLLSRGSDLKMSLAPFIRSFGEIQVCCMLIALACGVQSDPLTSEHSASSVLNRRATAKSDDFIFATAMQGIFECGQGPAGVSDKYEPAETNANASTRIVLTTEFGMSYQHDGLTMFISRVLRPLWHPKTLGKRVTVKTSPSSSTTSYESTYSMEKLDEIREILFQLRQLMESAGPYAVAITGGSVLENNASLDGDADPFSRASELANRYQKSRNEEQLKQEMRFKAEQRSLYFLYRMILRSIEAISLLRLAMENKVSLEEPLAKLNFSEFVSTADGVSAAKTMIKAIMRGRNENNQFLIKQLREQCPSYFSVSDLWHYQGYKSLAQAKLSVPSSRKAHLKESLGQFLNSCHLWDTEDCIEVLQGICEDYILLNYYEGVVKLTLACAKNFHDAAATDLSGVKLSWKRSCFGCILLALQRLLGDDSGQSPQSVDDMVSLDEETRNKYVEEIFHFSLASEDSEFHQLLYTWLYENDHKRLLTSIRSPFIEDFLKEKDQDLLIKLYMDQQKYLVAAKVWWSRAHEDTDDDRVTDLEGNPDIMKRQYYVSKALGCLKSLEEVGEAADAIREVRDVLDVLQLQVRVLKALEQSTIEMEASASSLAAVDDALRERKQDLKRLSFKIFDATTLYNEFASKYDMWSECLHIIHSCNSEEADVVASLWRKIIFSVIPASSSNSDFNAWRADQCDLAGLSSQSSAVSSFESGLWIGQLQCKVLRLGKTLYFAGDDAHGGSSGAALGGFVFPVGFLAKQLEQVLSWYLRLTQLTAYPSAMSVSSSSADSTAFNWVIKVFLDVGVPHRELLSYYEQLYREQSSLSWTRHLLQSMFAIITLWRKHAISPRAGKDQLADFAACCPHIVDLCDDFITDLQATPFGTCSSPHWRLDVKCILTCVSL